MLKNNNKSQHINCLSVTIDLYTCSLTTKAQYLAIIARGRAFKRYGYLAVIDVLPKEDTLSRYIKNIGYALPGCSGSWSILAGLVCVSINQLPRQSHVLHFASVSLYLRDRSCVVVVVDVDTLNAAAYQVDRHCGDTAQTTWMCLEPGLL